ncbi:MAG: hypothetical protein HY042_02630 [Spirochaetia bacterium]|nr:hypothetical protein [Spirochaetia bacterium]
MMVLPLHAGSLWQDYKKLRLVCFWKRVNGLSAAKSPVFPAANRRDVSYEFQEIMKHADISAHMFIDVSPGIQLMAESLLQEDPTDTALVTTRLGLTASGQGFGDNHDVKRNASGLNYVPLPANRAGSTPEYVSYSCGVYELPLPAQPRLSPGLEVRIPPIH